MKRKIISTLLALVLVLSFGLVTAAPAAAAVEVVPDRATVITTAADKLVDVQGENGDGGFPWKDPYGDSATNILGITAMGILKAWEIDSKDDYDVALAKAYKYVVDNPPEYAWSGDKYIEQTAGVDSCPDITFLVELAGAASSDANLLAAIQAAVPETTPADIANLARTRWDNLILHLGSDNAETPDGDATGYAEWERDRRHGQGLDALIPWQLELGVKAALALENDQQAVDIASVIFASVDDGTYFDSSDTTQEEYTAGLTGAIEAYREVDLYPGEVTRLTDLLLDLQQADGYWNYYGATPAEKAVQSTAYAIMALVAEGSADSISAANAAAAWLSEVQYPDGGWYWFVMPEGGDPTECYEVNSEAAWALAQLAAPVTVGEDGKGYYSIQDGIDASVDDDTIDVAAGTYNERININKSLTVRGANSGIKATETRGPESIIDAQALEFGVLIDGADTVATFSGFTVKNYARGGIVAGAFSLENDPDEVAILNNIVHPPVTQENNNCIQVGDGTTGTVAGNEVKGASLESEDWSGSGILVAGSSGVLVSNNYVHDCEGGIQVIGYGEYRDAPAENNIIEHNLVKDNETGISSQGNVINTTIRYNDILDSTDVGIGVMALDVSWPEHSTPSGTLIQENNIFGSANCGVESSVWGSDTGTVEAETLDIATILINNDFDRAVTVEHEDLLLPTIWSNIQDGINEAAEGDTVFVSAGTYPEKVATKTAVKLIGAGSSKTIIAPATGGAVTLLGWLVPSDQPIDGFKIQGFTLKPPKYSYAFLAGSGTPDGSYYITNLEFDDIVVDGQLGICLNATEGAILTDVQLRGIKGSEYEGGEIKGALELTGVSDLSFTDGIIEGNAIGVRLQPGIGTWGNYGPNGNIQIHKTDFGGNTVAIENQDAATIIDATDNWWGNKSGPTHSKNAGGTGDVVTDKVKYRPWMPVPKDEADDVVVEEIQDDYGQGSKEFEGTDTTVDTTGTEGSGDITVTSTNYGPPKDTGGTTLQAGTGKQALKYVDVKIKKSTYTGDIRIAFSYTDEDLILMGINEYDLSLYYYDMDAGEWVEAANVVVDVDNNTISGDIPADKFTGLPIACGGDPSTAIENIDKHLFYDTIQLAVDDADPGNTIVLDDGTYSVVGGETFPVEVNVPGLTIKSLDGAADTIIEPPSDSESAFMVTVPGVTIGGYPDNGFTIVSGGRAGIYATVDGGKGINVLANIFKSYAPKESRGMWFEKLWAGAVVAENSYATPRVGTGIIVVNSDGATIVNNRVESGTIEWTFLALRAEAFYPERDPGNPYSEYAAENPSLINLLQVTGNYITGVTGGAIRFVASNHHADHGEPQAQDLTVGPGGILVNGNTLINNAGGVVIDEDEAAPDDPDQIAHIFGAERIHIHTNHFIDNECAVYNGQATEVNAKANWWNDVAGPLADTNPYWDKTNGEMIMGSMDYLPWMIQFDLDTGWNIISWPITGVESDEADIPPEIIAAHYFNSETQKWGSPGDGSGPLPLDAMYIKTTAPVTVGYVISDDATVPSQKDMKVGWNFIGLAQLYPMPADEALLDIYFGTGEAKLGFSKVLSPSLNGKSWTYLTDAADAPDLIPTKGYWVFMVNDGVLGGFTTTPIMELEPEP